MEKYNGWTNRDTWLVALWLDNDRKNYEKMQKERFTLSQLSDRALKNTISNYHFGDDVNFQRVDWSEIREMIAEHEEA